MGNEYIESIVWLQEQIINIMNTSSSDIPEPLVLNSSEILTMNAARLRGWLYSYYSHTQQWQLYDGVHARANIRHKRRRLDLTLLAMALRDDLFDDPE